MFILAATAQERFLKAPKSVKMTKTTKAPKAPKGTKTPKGTKAPKAGGRNLKKAKTPKGTKAPKMRELKGKGGSKKASKSPKTPNM